MRKEVEKQIMKYTRWLQWQSRLIGVAAAMLFFVLSVQAQTDVILPPIGGSGGGQFAASGRCPQGQLLSGFKLRAGDWVDAIRPVCVIAYGPAEVAPNPSEAIYAVYPPPMFGGSGGDSRELLCPNDAPIVTGVNIEHGGHRVVTVNSIHVFCGLAATTQTPSQFPAAVFTGAVQRDGRENVIPSDWVKQSCPAGLVAVGINGRSGEWLDSVGLICGAPTLTPRPAPPLPSQAEVPSRPAVKAIGRTKVPGATTGRRRSRRGQSATLRKKLARATTQPPPASKKSA